MKRKKVIPIIILFVVFCIVNNVAAQKLLPFTQGSKWYCAQGNNNSFTHYGKSIYACDFLPILGNLTDIVAMEEGVVVALKKDICCSTYPNTKDYGNYISIKNNSGTYDHYAHLKYGSLLVNIGERVFQGQKIAELIWLESNVLF